MKEIVAVDRNWGIGHEGKLLKRIPEDMARFRKMTLNKVVIMGRATFASLPKQEPLADRVNIVLSGNPDFVNEKVTVCRSLDDLFETLAPYNPDDVYVIGGGRVYAELLPHCTEAYVTKIDSSYPADTHYPNLDDADGWELAWESEKRSCQDIDFHYTVYENQSPKPYGA